MKKILVWETSAAVAGGQKMTLTVMDLLKDHYAFHCLIPGEGALSQELEKRGIPYTLMGDQSLPAGVKGKSVYFRYGWLSLKNIWASLGAIRRHKPDLLYAPGPAALPWSAVCGAMTGKPVIWHLHHLFMDGPTKKLLNLTGKFKAVKRIAAVSQVVGDQMTHPRGREKVRCLYNPIDVSKYGSGDSRQLRSELGDAFILLETAVLRPSKCQDLFLRVVDALKKRGVPVVGVLVGDAITEEDRAFKESLLRQIEEYGLESDIRMEGYRTNVADYLAAADMVFVPSTVEGLSLAAQEAMAAKRDIIATEVGGVAELLRVAGCGTLYPRDATPEQIADLILTARAQDRRPAIESGYRFCRDHGPESYQKDLLELFDNG